MIFIDNKGTFLTSRDHVFAAQIINLRPELKSYYLVVTHVPSGAIVWSANRNTPISESSQLHFSTHGLTLYNDRGQPIWSTPEIMLSSISSLHLLDSGDLVLVDVENNVFWESFDHPTDVIVVGQRLKVGNSLVSSLSVDDLAEYMMFNFSGVYLMGDDGKQVVISVILSNSDDVSNNSSYFGIAKLFKDGVFRILRTNEKEYGVPEDACRIPFICGKLGLCSYGGACGCVAPFDTQFQGCLPKDGSLALSCNGSTNGLVTRYLSLSYEAEYFSNSFMDPVMLHVNLSACQSLCSSNCSCLAIFHSPSSGSCYMVSNYLGSMFNKSGLYDTGRIGYVKTMVMPSSIVMMIALFASVVWLKRRRKVRCKTADPNLSRGESGEFDFASFPGLPVRFKYEELTVATEGFKAQLGSGGFGTVYKGLLRDGTEVAVKKITCSGARGMKEFLMEIDAVGKVRHVNLRPSMADVVGMLEGWMPLGMPRTECLSFLWRYDPNERNELRSHRPPNIPTPNPCKSLSYVSAQLVLGPR
ncbi:G-type lectin S-receptor-like serine/threonine-protein kinase At5g35370 [Henckelia pumila]|uniref:G-type lectin S-receptor-like serine/threonine-protein kinase At5g35370 n=1 Tax=Henckelia pumila TaxID=405737 RepID=UPI003C6E45E1